MKRNLCDGMDVGAMLQQFPNDLCVSFFWGQMKGSKAILEEITHQQ